MLYTPSNVNFLKEVEILAQFDPIMTENLNRVQKSTSVQTSYLSHTIQNELVELLSSNILSEMVNDIKNKGVQARLLQINPRAIFVSCGPHTLNLVVADASKASTDALNQFGILHKLFTMFSASTQRWAVLKKHVGITLKMWTDTRWENKLKSVEPLRYEAATVREALIEVRDHTKDPIIKVEAQSLSEEVGSYRFSICTVVWYRCFYFNLTVSFTG